MRIVLSGGGTGGHIYPALAVAKQALQQMPDCELLYIGSNRGLEKELVAKEDIAFESIEITGFRRKLSWDNIKTIIRFLRGVRRVRKLLKKFKPDIVIGTGGYVCGPVVFAAAKLGIPTLLHEQNVIPGLTNAFLSRYANTVMVSFAGSQMNFPKAKHVVYTGNPRASQVVSADAGRGRSSLGLNEQDRLIVIVGGSGGAKAINDAMAELAPFIQKNEQFRFLFITGQSYYDNTFTRIREQLSTIPEHLLIKPYIHNMPEVLAATTLIIGRAGASSLAEITALGIPSILIPSPNVTNNHQEANARWLEKEGAAKVILESELNGEFLYNSILKIADDAIRYENMSKQAKRLGKPDAASAIIQELSKLSG